MKYLKISSTVLIFFACLHCKSQRNEELTLAFFEAEAVYNRDQNPKLAIKLLDSLLNIDPTACRGYWVKGNCHKDLMQYGKALNAFKKSVSCRSSFYGDYVEIGDIYHKMNQLDSAEYYFLKALELEPFESLIYYNLGVVYTSKDQYLKAIDYLTKCIDMEPIEDVYYLRSNAYIMIEEYRPAFNDIKSHFQLHPEDYRGLFLEGEILNELGNYQESIEALTTYLTNPVNKGEDYVNFMIGLNYYKLNEIEKSCDYLKEAENLGYEDKMLTELLQNCNP